MGLAEFLGIALAPVVLAAATVLFLRRASGEGRVGWPGLLAGNVLLALCLTSVVLLGFEAHLRFVYDASDGDNRTKVSRRWFQRHWKLNSLGFRDDVDYSLERTPGRPRISFLGDSFTAGHGVARVEERYVNRLRERHPEWELHALAIPGLETPEETQLLRQLLGRGYELDVVVLAYYVENVGRFVPELRRYFAEAAQPLPQPWRFLVDHSYAVDTFFYRAQTRLMYGRGYWNDVYRRAYAGPAWELQQAAFARLHELVLRHGGRFAAVSFPTLAGVEDRRAVLERIDALFEAWGVPHLDLLPVFERYSSRELVANPHDAHPSAFAHALATDAIELFLQESVLRTAGGAGASR